MVLVIVLGEEQEPKMKAGEEQANFLKRDKLVFLVPARDIGPILGPQY